MASQLHDHHQLHFVLIPLMSPGHLIPMVDMSRILAQHGVIVSIVTTPLNAIRFSSTIQRAVESGLSIQLHQLQFPSVEVGLPEGCENIDRLPSRDLIKNFFHAASLLQQPFEQLFDSLQPRPSCLISGRNLPWTTNTSFKFKIPLIFFDGMGCFAFSCTHNLMVSKVHESVSKFESFVVPGLAHRIELTKSKLPENLNPSSQSHLKKVCDHIRSVEHEAEAIVVNTFEELETEYVKEYKRVKGNNVWCIGPVSACNKLKLDKAERGEKASVDEKLCLNWLDSWEYRSVVYACLGSICGLTTCQLVELGLGLEASNKPFIWFMNEKLVVEVLGIGASAGVEAAVTWGLEDKFGLLMKREQVKDAIQKVMDKGKQGDERRLRARELGEKAKCATEQGGSSYQNIEKLIQFVLQQTMSQKFTS
ncbi:hypothetical protein Q3G72_010462 [Acer saccharum]|nr:hypothetical protein Q3G72_010462 [Acer saccharum]